MRWWPTVVAAVLTGAVLAVLAAVVAVQVFLHTECVQVSGSVATGWVCR